MNQPHPSNSSSGQHQMIDLLSDQDSPPQDKMQLSKKSPHPDKGSTQGLLIDKIMSKIKEQIELGRKSNEKGESKKNFV